MSKKYATSKSTSPQSTATITTDQVSMLHLKIESVARYFKTKLSDGEVLRDIQKQICKLNKVKHVTKLTQVQYNNTLHHLQNMEHVMHQYFWCISLIEDKLFNSLLARNIDNTNVLYNDRKFHVESNHLARVETLAARLINFNILKELY
jgi:hypothetical protein